MNNLKLITIMRISLQNIKNQIAEQTNFPTEAFRIHFKLIANRPHVAISFEAPFSDFDFERDIQYVTESNLISTFAFRIEQIKSKYNF